MALAVRLSTLESWTGPLACDDVLRARFPDVDGATNPILAAYLQTGDASHLGDLSGVCRVTVRPTDSDINLQIRAAVQDEHPIAGMSQQVAALKGIARACLVGFSDLPDLRRGATGFPVEGLKVLQDDAYSAALAEVATHANRLSALGKSHPPSCGVPSAPTLPGVTAAASLSAPDVTATAP